jgi:hypothetical protein
VSPPAEPGAYLTELYTRRAMSCCSHTLCTSVLVFTNRSTARAVNEQGAQVGVTAPANVMQARLAAGRILQRHQAQPGSQMPAVAELSSVADCSNDGRRCNWADAGYLDNLPAERRSLHKRVDADLDEVDAFFDHTQVHKAFGEERPAKRGELVGAGAQQFRNRTLELFR